MKKIEEQIDELLESVAKISKRKNVNKKAGIKKYGSGKFADSVNNKYPINSEEEIRAAWNYINMPKNAAEYPSGVSLIKSRIVRAWKDKIDKTGPPSASKADLIGSEYDCPFCEDQDDSYEHFSSHLLDLTEAIKEAQDKLKEFYEASQNKDLTAQEILDFVESIEEIIESSRDSSNFCKD